MAIFFILLAIFRTSKYRQRIIKQRDTKVTTHPEDTIITGIFKSDFELYF